MPHGSILKCPGRMRVNNASATIAIMRSSSLSIKWHAFQGKFHLFMEECYWNLLSFFGSEVHGLCTALCQAVALMANTW